MRPAHLKALTAFVLIICGWILPVFGETDIPPLIDKLKKTAVTDEGISKEEQQISERFWKIGPPAIPYLLPLLEDKNKEVRNLTSYILRDIKGLTAEHLDALIASRLRGDGWIPPAIARIGSPKAVDFLLSELVRERQTETQLTYAITLLGNKAIPGLVRIYQNDSIWDDDLSRTLYSVFHEMGKNAVAAIDPLLQIAGDKSAPIPRRDRAISAIGAIGMNAERAVPALLALMKTESPEIKDACEGAILGIGSKEAVSIYLEKLEKEPDPYSKSRIIGCIGNLGPGAKEAGPNLLLYLDSPDWDLRVSAAEALAFTGYSAATNQMIEKLNCAEDWRLVYVAIVALERFQAVSALPALTQVSKKHWYPPVREKAAKAIKTIRSGVLPKDFDYSGYEEVGSNLEHLSKEKLIRLPVAQTAVQTLEVEGGYLKGTDKGEFGGGLDFINSKGTSTNITGANTEAIYRFDKTIVAVTGLAHMLTNKGILYKIQGSEKEGWTAEKWLALPGAPDFSRLLKDGDLLISCRGGIVLVSPEGKMESVTRSAVSVPPSPKVKTKTDDLQERMETLLFPALKFDDLPIDEVLSKLEQISKTVDPDKIGIHFIISPSLSKADLKTKLVTLNLIKDVSVLDIIRVLGDLTGLSFKIEENSVAVYAR